MKEISHSLNKVNTHMHRRPAHRVFEAESDQGSENLNTASLATGCKLGLKHQSTCFKGVLNLAQVFWQVLRGEDKQV